MKGSIAREKKKRIGEGNAKDSQKAIKKSG